MSGANDEPRVVGDVGDLDSVRDQLRMALESRKTVGGGILVMRGWDNSLCDAWPDQVILCECGRPLKKEDRGHHVVATCCGQILEGCCGDV